MTRQSFPSAALGLLDTSLQTSTSMRSDAAFAGPDRVPDVVTPHAFRAPRAGRIVQSAGTVVHVELRRGAGRQGRDPVLAQDAFRDHHGWSRRGLQRLTIDRNKLEAANAAF